MKTRTPKRAENFPITPRLDFVYVADFGQPDRSRGGILLPEGVNKKQFWRYRYDLWRFGEVIAVGPGRPFGMYVEEIDAVPEGLVPMPKIEIGDTIMFSRKHGTRLGSGWTFKLPRYDKPLLIRVLDPLKCVAIINNFDPWWNVEDAQLNPDGVLTG